MGAAATLEAFMCLLSAQRGLIPPTLHLEEPDPECDLDYVPGRPRAGAPRVMLSTSWASAAATPPSSSRPP